MEANIIPLEAIALRCGAGQRSGRSRRCVTKDRISPDNWLRPCSWPARRKEGRPLRRVFWRRYTDL